VSDGISNKDVLGSARPDWSRVKRAVAYAESMLHERFSGDGLVRGRANRGWRRSRLRELLDAFPTPVDAQTWVEAACFRAKARATRPMAYFVKLVLEAANDAGLRDIRRLLTAEEFEASKRAGAHKSAAEPKPKGPA
jgi:hypothetical protein